MKRALIIVLMIIGISSFSFAGDNLIQFSGGIGTYAYFSPEELKLAADNNYELNYLDRMRVGALLSLNFNLSESFSLGVETGMYLNLNMANIAFGALQFDIPLYATLRWQPGIFFLQPQFGIIFDMTKIAEGSPLYEMAIAYNQAVPEEEAFSLQRFSVDLGSKIGIALGGLAIYADLGIIWDTFDQIGEDGFQVRLGAGIMFGV
jgi:hypothetical protein